MKLNFSDLEKDLEAVCEQMVADMVNPEVVGYIGSKTEFIGDFFADRFDCESVYLPSLHVNGHTRAAKKMLNAMLRHFPERALVPISNIYKKYIQSASRCIPEGFTLDGSLNYEGDSPILLVDDSAFTGETLDAWKQEVEKTTGKKVYTFSITVIDGYRPDYYCIEDWRPFEWRPIGV
tara:strand:+ start:154 stop:687 length:534 start_codon:yes stop_codon:yes gene_type:complete